MKKKFRILRASTLDDLEKLVNDLINGPGRWYPMSEVLFLQGEYLIQMRDVPIHPELKR
jgi:hypothetical protein